MKSGCEKEKIVIIIKKAERKTHPVIEAVLPQGRHQVLNGLLSEVHFEQGGDELEGVSFLHQVVHEEHAEQGHGSHLLSKEDAAGHRKLVDPRGREPVQQPENLRDGILKTPLQVAEEKEEDERVSTKKMKRWKKKRKRVPISANEQVEHLDMLLNVSDVLLRREDAERAQLALRKLTTATI